MIPPSFVCLLWFSKSYLGYSTYSHLNIRVLFLFLPEMCKKTATPNPTPLPRFSEWSLVELEVAV